MGENLKFAVVGRLKVHRNRDELAAVIRSVGGEITDEVTSTTNFVIRSYPDFTSSKTRIAKRLKIPFLTEDELLEKFVRKHDDGLAKLQPIEPVVELSPHEGDSTDSEPLSAVVPIVPEGGEDVASSPVVSESRSMKYKCLMCGTMVDADHRPELCEACGMNEFEPVQYDARCEKCGAGYYSSDGVEVCPCCGASFVEKSESAKRTSRKRRSSGSASTRTTPTRSATASSASHHAATVRHTSAPRATASPTSSGRSSSSSSSSSDTIATIIVLVLILGGIVALIVWAWPVISAIFGFLWWIVKAAWWIVCLPFKLIGWLLG